MDSAGIFLAGLPLRGLPNMKWCYLCRLFWYQHSNIESTPKSHFKL